jgi:hypothetical protein
MKQWNNELSHFDLSDLITNFQLYLSQQSQKYIYTCAITYIHAWDAWYYQCKCKVMKTYYAWLQSCKGMWSHKNHTMTIFTLSHLKHYNITYWNYYNEFLHNVHTWNGPFFTQGNMCMDIDNGASKYALGVKTWWSNCALWLILNYCNEGNFVPSFHSKYPHGFGETKIQ